MPQIDDLPLPAQNQLRAQRGELPQESQPDAKRRTLLERLASFGMSRQEDVTPPQTASAAPQVPAPYQGQGRVQPNSIHAEYAKRPAAPIVQRPPQLPLDHHGRIAAQPRTAEEDHLEIPAFLRRQSN
jgi:cell division protein FtsZ